MLADDHEEGEEQDQRNESMPWVDERQRMHLEQVTNRTRGPQERRVVENSAPESAEKYGETHKRNWQNS